MNTSLLRQVARASARTTPVPMCLCSSISSTSSKQPASSSSQSVQPTSTPPPSTQSTSPLPSSATSPHASQPLPASESTTTGSSPSAGSSRTTGPNQRRAEDRIRERLQNAVLDRVPTLGWTAAAVRDALSSLGLSSASAALLPAGPASVAATFEADCNRLLAEHLHARMQRTSVNNNPTATTSAAQADSPSDPLSRTLPPSQAPVTGGMSAAQGNDPSPGPHAASTKPSYVGANSDTSYVEHDDSSDGSPAARAAYAITFRLRLLDPYHQLWYQAVALRARMPRTALRNRLLLTDEVAAYASYNTPDVSFQLCRNALVFRRRHGPPVRSCFKT